MAAKSDAIFAANRAVGTLSFSVKHVAGKTRRGDVHEAGSLRVRCPGAPSDELEAVLINTAGGVAGGDRFALDIAAGEGTQLVVTTAAAEKVYRTLGADLDHRREARCRGRRDARLAAAGDDPVRSRAARRVRSRSTLAADARLFLAEAIVFGRSGMGETVRGGRADRSLARAARRQARSMPRRVRLDGAIAARLARGGGRASGGVAVATVLIVPGDDAVVAAVRALQDDFAGEVGASALEWHRGGAPVRAGRRGVTARSRSVL